MLEPMVLTLKIEFIPDAPKAKDCYYQKRKKEIFCSKASRGSMEFRLQLLYDNNAYWTAIIHKQISHFK